MFARVRCTKVYLSANRRRKELLLQMDGGRLRWRATPSPLLAPESHSRRCPFGAQVIQEDGTLDRKMYLGLSRRGIKCFRYEQKLGFFFYPFVNFCHCSSSLRDTTSGLPHLADTRLPRSRAHPQAGLQAWPGHCKERLNVAHARTRNDPESRAADDPPKGTCWSGTATSTSTPKAALPTPGQWCLPVQRSDDRATDSRCLPVMRRPIDLDRRDFSHETNLNVWARVRKNLRSFLYKTW